MKNNGIASLTMLLSGRRGDLAQAATSGAGASDPGLWSRPGTIERVGRRRNWR
jgi:hypothetical protein